MAHHTFDYSTDLQTNALSTSLSQWLRRSEADFHFDQRRITPHVLALRLYCGGIVAELV